jgi:hypothetical protein
MAAVTRKYRELLYVVLTIAAAPLVLTMLEDRVQADEARTFVIPVDDGYGLGDCLGKNQGCAEAVAATWCEAHGFAAPTVYGRAEDMVTSATSTVPQSAHVDPNSFIVTCRN